MRNNEIILEVSLFKEEDGAFKEKDGGTFKEKGGGTFKEKEKTSTFKEKEKTSTFKEKENKKEKGKGEEKKKEEVTQKDNFPINTVEKSNAFRTYLKERQPGFVASQGSKFKEKISDTETKQIADEVIKDAWKKGLGDEFIKYLQSSSNSVLSGLAVALNTDNLKFQQSPSGKISAADLLQKELEFEKQKCEPWITNNVIEKKYPNDIERNQMTEEFIEWCDTNGFINSQINTDEYCGFSKFDIGEWLYNDWEFKDNSYENYRHPIVKLMALTPTYVKDEFTGRPITTNLFKRFLKEEKGEEVVKNSKIKTQNVNKNKVNIDVDDLENEPTAANDWADLIMLSPIANRQLCKGLRDSLNSSYSNGKTVQSAISKCNSRNPDWLDTSVEGRVKSKLRLFQENKHIQKKLTEKLKSKKTFKVLKENFEKQNYRKFFDNLSQVSKLNESTNAEFEKSFDTIFHGKETEFKNKAIEYILNKLEVSQTSELGKNIKSELDKIPAKDMFRNEYDVPEAVSKAVELSSQTTDEENGLKGIVSKSIKFDDKQIKQGVRQHLHDYIEGVKTDIKSLEQKLKSSIVKGL